jgi:hypothetical protein
MKRQGTETSNMKFIMTTVLFLCIVAIPPTLTKAQPKDPGSDSKPNNTWQPLTDGLELGVFQSPHPSEIGDSLVRVLRIDPNRFIFRLLNASAHKSGRPQTAKEWCRQNGLVAAINASMFQEDYKTSVSLMRTRSHVNNPRLSKDMTILAFDRLSQEVPPVKIIDRQCEDFNNWKPKYGTLVQSIRMISCTGENKWSQQSKKWSTAAIGIDHRDRVLFIHVGSPFSTHDLINILQMLPLNIARAMYAEGGPQAQLYIKIDESEHEFIGNYEININENSNALFSWPIPNAVGIALKNAPVR